MLAGKRVIAVIPARGGSKTVPGKNIRPLAGRPLIAWSIAVARDVAEIDRVIVSTDDAQIAAVGRQNGAEVYMRPAHLATDEALVIDALKDLVRTLHAEQEAADWLVLLEPTCPLRAAGDVRDCLQLAGRGSLDSVATFTEAELHPHRAWSIVDGVPQVFVPGAVPWMPRQKLPRAYQLNGAVYAVRTDLLFGEAKSLLLGRSGAVVMPRTRSIDINDEIDLLVAEQVMRRANHE